MSEDRTMVDEKLYEAVRKFQNGDDTDQLWYMIENDMLPENIAQELAEKLKRM